MPNDKLIKQINLKYLEQFHRFDTDFQSLLFKYSVKIEVKLKHKLAYVISKNFGVDCSCIAFNSIEDSSKRPKYPRAHSLQKLLIY